MTNTSNDFFLPVYVINLKDRKKRRQRYNNTNFSLKECI